MAEIPVWYLKDSADNSIATSKYAEVLKLIRKGWVVYKVYNDPFKTPVAPKAPVNPPEPPPFTAQLGS